jgi:6-phosphofructokinase 1
MRIAVLTSGGDAPGMNAAIRAVVRTAVARGWPVLGVRNGYAGLMGGEFIPLGARNVGGILEHGGTVLGSARAPEFCEDAGQTRALHKLKTQNVEGLIVIGGNGSQTGAAALAARGLPVVGVASTIDNDLYGTDVTIGVDTALNVALEAIDRLKVTGSSHGRGFVVETMGRDCGYLALMAGLAGGAEMIVIPEVPTEPDDVAEALRKAYERGKAHAIIVVAEGAEHDGEALVRYFREHTDRFGFEPRLTVLGHVQRGGTPTFADRILATRLGAAAVEQLATGNHGVLVGMVRDQIHTTPLAEVARSRKQLDTRMIELARVLAQ